MTGTTSGSWSNGANWSGSKTDCTVAGGPVAGTKIVFPPGATTTTIAYDNVNGTPATSFNEIEFDGGYTINEGTGTPGPITLTPGDTTSCSNTSTSISLCDAATTGSSVKFYPGIILGSAAEFADAGGPGMWVYGVVSGSNLLTVGDSSNGGTVLLEPLFSGSCTSNGYTGGTTLANGQLDLLCPSGLGTGTLTISGGFFAPSLFASGTISNTIVDNSTSPGVVVCASNTGVITTLSGLISGSGSLDTGYVGCHVGTVVLDNTPGDTYSGGTTRSPTSGS